MPCARSRRSAAERAGAIGFGYGAVQLFIARVRATDPHFARDQRIAAVTAAICRCLDGIALAIELAAARAAALGVEGVAAHLDDRFQLLTGGRRTAPLRHRTPRATLDWSYALLPERERLVFRRLSIFANGFGLKAAVAVAASVEVAVSDIIDYVANLVAKSLVMVDISGGPVRYQLLETTCAYAREKLAESGELGQVARAHAERYRNLFERPRSNGRRGPPLNGGRIMAAGSTICGRRWTGPFRRAATHRSASR